MSRAIEKSGFASRGAASRVGQRNATLSRWRRLPVSLSMPLSFSPPHPTYLVVPHTVPTLSLTGLAAALHAGRPASLGWEDVKPATARLLFTRGRARGSSPATTDVRETRQKDPKKLKKHAGQGPVNAHII